MRITTYQKHRMLAVIKNTKSNSFYDDRVIAESILKAECNIYNRNFKRHNRNLTILSSMPISFEKRHRFKVKFININDLKNGFDTFANINKTDFHHVIFFEPTVNELKLLRKDSNVAIIFTVSHFCVPKDKIEDFGRKMINEYNLQYCIIRYRNESFRMYAICKDDRKVKLFVINDIEQLSFLINNDWFGRKTEIKYSDVSVPGSDKIYKEILDKVEPYFLHIKTFKDIEIGYLFSGDLILNLKSDIQKYSIFKNILAKDTYKNNYVVCSTIPKGNFISSNAFDITNIISSLRVSTESLLFYRKPIFFVFVPAEVNYIACPNVVKYFHSNRVMSEVFSNKEYVEFEQKPYHIIYHENIGYYILSCDIKAIEIGLKELSISFISEHKKLTTDVAIKAIEEITTYNGKVKKNTSLEFKNLPLSLSKEFLKYIKNDRANSDILFYGQNSYYLSEHFRFEQYRHKLTIYNDVDAMAELKSHKKEDRLLLSFGNKKFEKVVLFNYFDYVGLSKDQFLGLIKMFHKVLRPDGEIVFNCFDFENFGNLKQVKYTFPKYSGHIERTQVEDKAMLKINYKNIFYISEHTYISKNLISLLEENFEVSKELYGNVIAIYKLKKKGASL